MLTAIKTTYTLLVFLMGSSQQIPGFKTFDACAEMSKSVAESYRKNFPNRDWSVTCVGPLVTDQK